MTHRACPDCGLVVHPHGRLVMPHYCPRCLARRRTAVALVTGEPTPWPAGTRFGGTPKAARSSTAGPAGCDHG
jgi:hypothetical protein